MLVKRQPLTVAIARGSLDGGASLATSWQIRIEARCRARICQLAAENRFGGAPRIHGELLKLGLAISECTVPRYLSHRREGDVRDLAHVPDESPWPAHVCIAGAATRAWGWKRVTVSSLRSLPNHRRDERVDRLNLLRRDVHESRRGKSEVGERDS